MDKLLYLAGHFTYKSWYNRLRAKKIFKLSAIQETATLINVISSNSDFDSIVFIISTLFASARASVARHPKTLDVLLQDETCWAWIFAQLLDTGK